MDKSQKERTCVRSFLLHFQKALVVIGGGAADIAAPCQFADAQLLALAQEIKMQTNLLAAHTLSVSLRSPKIF